MWRSMKFVALHFREQGLHTSLDQLAYLKDYFGENDDEADDPWGKYMKDPDRLLEPESFRI